MSASSSQAGRVGTSGNRSGSCGSGSGSARAGERDLLLDVLVRITWPEDTFMWQEDKEADACPLLPIQVNSLSYNYNYIYI